MLMFDLFRMLSIFIVLILFAILGFIIYKGAGVLSWDFLSKAPESKIAEEKGKLEKYTQMMEQVKERLAALKR